MTDPGQLLRLADEMVGRAEEDEGFAVLAVLAAHTALESLVNQLGRQEIKSFNERARFLPKWHDLCRDGPVGGRRGSRGRRGVPWRCGSRAPHVARIEPPETAPPDSLCPRSGRSSVPLRRKGTTRGRSVRCQSDRRAIIGTKLWCIATNTSTGRRTSTTTLALPNHPGENSGCPRDRQRLQDDRRA
jgi:hypothetical protein